MWRAGAEHVTRLESLCDRFGEGLPELESFILPGGSDLCARLHLARTVCRRAERTIVSLSESTDPQDAVSADVIRYVNRVSDLLFVLGRWALQREGKAAPLWAKASKRALP